MEYIDWCITPCYGQIRDTVHKSLRAHRVGDETPINLAAVTVHAVPVCHELIMTLCSDKVQLVVTPKVFRIVGLI